MSSKKNKYSLNAEQQADAFVFPNVIPVSERKKATQLLAEARARHRVDKTEKEQLAARILQFRYQMEDYLNQEKFSSHRSFGYFLKEYVAILQKKRKEFAREINIGETELSQLINRHRLPNETILIRLEIHSNKSIPALFWYRLIAREKEHEIVTNQALRRQERKYVSKQLPAVH